MSFVIATRVDHQGQPMNTVKVNQALVLWIEPHPNHGGCEIIHFQGGETIILRTAGSGATTEAPSSGAERWSLGDQPYQ